MSSRSTADLLAVVSDRIVALDVSTTSLLHKLKSYRISRQIYGLSSFLSNRWLRVALDRKPSQKYPVAASLEPLAHRQNVANLSCIILVDFHLNWLY